MKFFGFAILLVICSDGPTIGYHLSRSRPYEGLKSNFRSLNMATDSSSNPGFDHSDKPFETVLELDTIIEAAGTIPEMPIAPSLQSDSLPTTANDKSAIVFGPVIAVALVPIAAFLIWKNLQIDDDPLTTTATDVKVIPDVTLTREEILKLSKEEQIARRNAIIANTKADFAGRVEVAREKAAKENEIQAILAERLKLEEERQAAMKREAEQKEMADEELLMAKRQEEKEVARLAAAAKKEAEEKEVARLAAVAKKEAEEKEVARLAAVAKKEAEEKEVARLAAVASKEAEEKEVARLAAVAKKEAEEKEVARLAALASKKQVTADKASLRLKLEKEAEAKWDAEIAAARLGQENKDDLKSSSNLVKDLAVKKTKMMSTAESVPLSTSSFPLNAKEADSMSSLPSRTIKAKKTTASVTSTGTVSTSDNMDIFDLIMKASLETEKAGKADQVS